MTFTGPANLANVTVILVESATAGNVGSAARAMKTMGLFDLVVVNGVNFKGSQQAIMMGHGAADLIERARELPTWDAATEGLHWLIGTTHRKRRAYCGLRRGDRLGIHFRAAGGAEKLRQLCLHPGAAPAASVSNYARRSRC